MIDNKPVLSPGEPFSRWAARVHHPRQLRSDVETLWNYHDMQHELHPCDVGVGLGSHDLGVAIVAVRLVA